MFDPFVNPQLAGREAPLHHFFDEPDQYLVKVQTYSNAPPELTISRRSFDRDVKRYRAAYDRGSSNAFPLPKKGRSAPLPGAVRDPESIERSQRRAKTEVRKKVCELAPNHFTTFTTREAGPDYFTPSDWASMWSRFVGLMRQAGQDFQYVAVLERHPKNPQHLHLHVAWRGHAHYRLIRRLWHVAILAHSGRRVTVTQYGEDSPGNVQDQPVKAPRGSYKQTRKIARYISKYITKDLISEFNKKRYWPSKGINLAAASVFWLDGLTQGAAIREALGMFGLWDEEIGAPLGQHIFKPSERVAWLAVDPLAIPPPF
jgi:hypothetical protein